MEYNVASTSQASVSWLWALLACIPKHMEFVAFLLQALGELNIGVVDHEFRRSTPCGLGCAPLQIRYPAACNSDTPLTYLRCLAPSCPGNSFPVIQRPHGNRDTF